MATVLRLVHSCWRNDAPAFPGIGARSTNCRVSMLVSWIAVSPINSSPNSIENSQHYGNCYHSLPLRWTSTQTWLGFIWSYLKTATSTYLGIIRLNYRKVNFGWVNNCYFSSYYFNIVIHIKSRSALVSIFPWRLIVTSGLWHIIGLFSDKITSESGYKSVYW